MGKAWPFTFHQANVKNAAEPAGHLALRMRCEGLLRIEALEQLQLPAHRANHATWTNAARRRLLVPTLQKRDLFWVLKPPYPRPACASECRIQMNRYGFQFPSSSFGAERCHARPARMGRSGSFRPSRLCSIAQRMNEILKLALFFLSSLTPILASWNRTNTSIHAGVADKLMPTQFQQLSDIALT